MIKGMSDFYEDDEPVEEIMAAFEMGHKWHTHLEIPKLELTEESRRNIEAILEENEPLHSCPSIPNRLALRMFDLLPKTAEAMLAQFQDYNHQWQEGSAPKILCDAHGINHPCEETDDE